MRTRSVPGKKFPRTNSSTKLRDYKEFAQDSGRQVLVNAVPGEVKFWYVTCPITRFTRTLRLGHINLRAVNHSAFQMKRIRAYHHYMRMSGLGMTRS